MSHPTSNDRIHGIVQGLTFRNEENGFFVARIKVEGQKNEQYVVGSAPVINVGEYLTASGSWAPSSWGRQFKANHVEVTPPTMLEGIEKYLASSVEGIGPGYAKKLVTAFGEAVFDVIEQEPKKLREVPGIGPKRADSILAAYNEQKAIRGIMVFLHKNGLSAARAKRVYEVYGASAVKRIQENPYCLCKDIWGIGFDSADKVAQRLGIEKHSDYRIRAGIWHIVHQSTSEGSCGLPVSQVLEKASELLGVSYEDLLRCIDLELACDPPGLIKDVAAGEICLFPPRIYAGEKYIADRLIDLVRRPLAYPIEDMDSAILHAEIMMGITLEEVQRRAVQTALSYPVCVITGGPGTGKTTITRIILEVLKDAGLSVLVCAPTGKAAQRAAEATGEPATTVHRTLEFGPGGKFKRNEDNPLDSDSLAADEFSMVDVPLAVSALKALTPKTRLIIIGDVDQIPSVGPGKVLADIIDSGALPTVRLTEVFRQAKTSSIVRNAHRVNQGLPPDFYWDGDSDFGFLSFKETEEIQEALLKTARDIWKKGFDPIRDVQVLTPMRRGPLGAIVLNDKLREILNPKPETKLQWHGTTYGSGDKVMQLRNNYKKNIFNGDIGFILEADDASKTLTVDFNGEIITYKGAELDELTLAYAFTVHKSQGSEFPVVLMPLDTGHFMMLKRNLLYTGMTRAKKLMMIFGKAKAAMMAVQNSQVDERFSKLADWLRAAGAQRIGVPLAEAMAA